MRRPCGGPAAAWRGRIRDSRPRLPPQARRVPKAVARHLDTLLGPWYRAMADPATEVSDTASQAYTDCFGNGERRQRVLASFGGALLGDVHHIVRQTQEGMRQHQTDTEVDLRRRFERVVTTALHVLADLLREADADLLAQLTAGDPSPRKGGLPVPALRQVAQPHLATLLASDHGPVRGAALDLGRTMCTAAPDVFEATLPSLAEPLVAALADAEPANQRRGWDAVLTVAQRAPGCWTHARLPRRTLPALIRTLRSAGGDARAAYDGMLPLLSLLPASAHPKGLAPVVRKLLPAMWRGLHTDQGRIRAADITTSYCECAVFLLSRRGDALAAAGLSDKDAAETRAVASDALVSAATYLATAPQQRCPEWLQLPLCAALALALRRVRVHWGRAEAEGEDSVAAALEGTYRSIGRALTTALAGVSPAGTDDDDGDGASAPAAQAERGEGEAAAGEAAPADTAARRARAARRIAALLCTPVPPAAAASGEKPAPDAEPWFVGTALAGSETVPGPASTEAHAWLIGELAACCAALVRAAASAPAERAESGVGANLAADASALFAVLVERDTAATARAACEAALDAASPLGPAALALYEGTLRPCVLAGLAALRGAGPAAPWRQQPAARALASLLPLSARLLTQASTAGLADPARANADELVAAAAASAPGGQATLLRMAGQMRVAAALVAAGVGPLVSPPRWGELAARVAEAPLPANPLSLDSMALGVASRGAGQAERAVRAVSVLRAAVSGRHAGPAAHSASARARATTEPWLHAVADMTSRDLRCVLLAALLGARRLLPADAAVSLWATCVEGAWSAVHSAWRLAPGYRDTLSADDPSARRREAGRAAVALDSTRALLLACALRAEEEEEAGEEDEGEGPSLTESAGAALAPLLLLRGAHRAAEAQECDSPFERAHASDAHALWLPRASLDAALSLTALPPSVLRGAAMERAGESRRAAAAAPAPAGDAPAEEGAPATEGEGEGAGGVDVAGASLSLPPRALAVDAAWHRGKAGAPDAASDKQLRVAWGRGAAITWHDVAALAEAVWATPLSTGSDAVSAIVTRHPQLLLDAAAVASGALAASLRGGSSSGGGGGHRGTLPARPALHAYSAFLLRALGHEMGQVAASALPWSGVGAAATAWQGAEGAAAAREVVAVLWPLVQPAAGPQPPYAPDAATASLWAQQSLCALAEAAASTSEDGDSAGGSESTDAALAWFLRAQRVSDATLGPVLHAIGARVAAHAVVSAGTGSSAAAEFEAVGEATPDALVRHAAALAARARHVRGAEGGEGEAEDAKEAGRAACERLLVDLGFHPVGLGEFPFPQPALAAALKSQQHGAAPSRAGLSPRAAAAVVAGHALPLLLAMPPTERCRIALALGEMGLEGDASAKTSAAAALPLVLCATEEEEGDDHSPPLSAVIATAAAALQRRSATVVVHAAAACIERCAAASAEPGSVLAAVPAEATADLADICADAAHASVLARGEEGAWTAAWAAGAVARACRTGGSPFLSDAFRSALCDCASAGIAHGSTASLHAAACALDEVADGAHAYSRAEAVEAADALCRLAAEAQGSGEAGATEGGCLQESARCEALLAAALALRRVSATLPAAPAPAPAPEAEVAGEGAETEEVAPEGKDECASRAEAALSACVQCALVVCAPRAVACSGRSALAPARAAVSALKAAHDAVPVGGLAAVAAALAVAGRTEALRLAAAHCMEVALGEIDVVAASAGAESGEGASPTATEGDEGLAAGASRAREAARRAMEAALPGPMRLWLAGEAGVDAVAAAVTGRAVAAELTGSGPCALTPAVGPRSQGKSPADADSRRLEDARLLRAWLALAGQLGRADKEARAVCVAWIKGHGVMQRVLDACVHCVPQLAGSRRGDFRAAAKVPANSRAGARRRAAAERDLLRPSTGPAAAALAAWDVTSLAVLGGRALLLAAQVVPTAVGQWWQDGGCTAAVGRRVAAYVQDVVAPLVVEAEVAAVKEAQQRGDFGAEMRVTGSVRARRVVAVFEQDEAEVEMEVSMPDLYPLKAVEVGCNGSMGVRKDKWRRWALQLRAVVAAQDGSVLDAVRQWKANLDAEFEGVEPCPICYCVLSATDKRLPSVNCRVCHTKFHSSCLYRWFASSNNTTCPMCRTPLM